MSQLEWTETRQDENEDRNEEDRRQTAPGRLTEWIILQGWMLQYWPARRVGYNISLSLANPPPPAERPKFATTRVSVEDKNSQID